MGVARQDYWHDGFRMGAEITEDAVVVIPGIMGSALRDVGMGELIWGLRASWYAKVWGGIGPGLSALAVSGDDLDSGCSRVEPAGLLTFPSFMPILAGQEPYTPLVREITKVVRHKSAIREFAYDWRLSIKYNTRLLSIAVQEHLAAWRIRSDRPDAQVVLVAHSMGGLLCQALTGISGALDGVRAVITLGTPFRGAAKAAVILARGEGAPVPLPKDRLREVAVTMPGVHELLPGYRCVHEGPDVRRLTANDVADLGGRGDWLDDIVARRTANADIELPRHHALVGVAQPTASTLTRTASWWEAHDYTFRTDRDGGIERLPTGVPIQYPGRGDATVPRNSARRRQLTPLSLPQQHATLASSHEACEFVRDVLVHGHADENPDLGPDDGPDGGVGMRLPDTVVPHEEWSAVLTGIEAYDADCVIEDADTNLEIGPPIPAHRTVEGEVRVDASLPAPGLYRVRVEGGSTPVTQFILATA